MADAALDNDVILKGASYGIINDLMAALPDGPFTHGALGAARFMLPKKLAKKQVSRMVDAQADLTSAFATLEVLEPDDEEKRLAAELQFNAQEASLELDPGEAQLTAMVIARDLRHLLTGDKRAIAALGATPFPEGLARELLTQRLICLEQAIWALSDAQGADTVRSAICAEPEVDTQLRICFSCTSPEVEEASWREGLRSAIEQVRHFCPDLLHPL
jgi:hypothetical protein